MSRYELLRIAQLVFALGLMFGAFLGGLAVGWWRWGRERSGDDRTSAVAAPAPPRPQRTGIKPDLFGPVDGNGVDIDLTTTPPPLVHLRPPEELVAPTGTVDPFR